MKNIIIIILSLLFVACFTNNVVSQSSILSQNQQDDLNAIFKNLKNDNAPGVAAAVVKDGKVVYSFMSGMEDMESNKKLTKSSQFNLGEMSGPFVAYSILWMERNGQLNLSDDIRKYIPELRDFRHVITINHLLNNTSGLQDYWTIKEIAGWESSQDFYDDNILKLINRQESLVFKPGSDFLPSFTNISLLVKIIESISEVGLYEFTSKNIFGPLGMNDTRYTSDSFNDLTQQAIPYINNDNVFNRNLSHSKVIGPLNLFTSLDDLSNWFCEASKTGTEHNILFNKMNSFAKRDDGSFSNTTNGTLTLGQQHVHAERGIDKVWQTGLEGSYASSVFHFATEGVTVFAMTSNGLDYNGQLSMPLASILLEDKFTEPPTTDYSKIKTTFLKKEELEKFVGNYWLEDWFVVRKIELVDDTLRYVRGGYSNALIPLSNNKFQMKVPSDDKVYFTFVEKEGKMHYEYLNGNSDPYFAESIELIEIQDAKLNKYTGVYYNNEFDLVYRIDLEDQQLVIKHLKNEDVRLNPVVKNLFTSHSFIIRSIDFNSDENEILGFSLNGQGIRNLEFQKLIVSQ